MPRVYRLVEQTAGELGIDLKLLERFEPWFLAVTLLDQGMRKFGFQARARHRAIRAQPSAANQQGNRGARDPRVPDRHLRLRCRRSQQQAMLEQTLAELDEAANGLERDGRRVARRRARKLERRAARRLRPVPGALRNAGDEAQPSVGADARAHARGRRGAVSSSSGRCTSSAATTSSSCCAHAATTWSACTERSL